MPSPTAEEIDDLLLSCRYGEIDDVKAFIDTYGAQVAAEARDERGSTVLHMAAANGHDELLKYLLPLLPPELLTTPNDSKSLPLHWATLNHHLPTVQLLASDPRVDGAHMIAIPNGAGKSSLAVAEEEGWEEGAGWLAGKVELQDRDGRVGEGETAEGVEEVDVGGDVEEKGEGQAMDVDAPEGEKKSA